MKSEEQIKNTIMRCVYGVYVLRLLQEPRTHFIGLGVALFVLGLSVSIKDIVFNMLAAARTPSGFLYYITDALVTTEFVVQVLAGLAAVLLVFAVRDICVFCVTNNVFSLDKQTT